MLIHLMLILKLLINHNLKLLLLKKDRSIARNNINFILSLLLLFLFGEFKVIFLFAIRAVIDG